ncbi:MAG: imidazole glycerol phosphate synthase subunit HisH [Catonella sp.]|nr:imidazole glycerol phosphate synthase subunit HisH [Catonella sp.]MDY6357022.1 imidazole glycerol phosphate synthase subunit HisH [Catonella sp.]
MISILDYDAGNIASVEKAIKYLGADCAVTRDGNTIMHSEAVILPGVGAFGDACEKLSDYGFYDIIPEYIKSGKPFLGICLGLQLLFKESEESPNASGLDILPGKIVKIPDTDGLKVPHIGWNSISINKKSRLLAGIPDNSYVYFVHSYYLKARDPAIVAATTEYGVTMHAACERENVFATQFHPEKSGEVGLKILKNFISIAKEA